MSSSSQKSTTQGVPATPFRKESAIGASDQSYLDQLTFDPKLATGVVAGYLRNFRLTLLLIIALTGAGLVSYFNIPQRLNPEINIPIVIVSTILPGASPQDVESLLTIPLEDQITSVTGIDTIVSSSTENASIITVQFVSGTDLKIAEQDVQQVVNKLTTLPSDALDPTVKALDFEDQPFWSFTLSSKEALPSLMRFSETLKKAIDKSDKVDRIQLSGFESQEIQLLLNPEKLREYAISPLQLSQIIKRASSAFPVGNVDTGSNTLSVTINPELTTVDDIRNIRLTANGSVVRLGELMTVQQRPTTNQQMTYFATSEQSPIRVVRFDIYKTRGADINAAYDEVEIIVKDTLSSVKDSFSIVTITNSSKEIREQFTELLGEFQTTIALVFLCLLLFVGIRQAIISAFTVPLTFLAAFIVMPIFGISINFLTLFAFLIALGLLIDDTIVIVSSMTTYYRTGKFTPHETGLLVWRDFIVPIWSTTITTIWAFIPLVLATGIIGEFIKPIPIVIAIVMISSTAIAVLITLPLMQIILKPTLPARVKTLLAVTGVIAIVASLIVFVPKSVVLPLIVLASLLVIYILAIGWKSLSQRFAPYFDKPFLNLDVIAIWYKNLIKKVLSSKKSRRRVIISIVLFAMLSYALVPLGLVKNEFFPKTDADLFFVNVEFPSGTNTTTIEAEAVPLLDQLRSIDEASFVSASIGQAGGGDFGGGVSGSNVLGVTVHLVPEEEREAQSLDIAQRVRQDLQSYTKGTVSVVEQSSGPPAGADVQIELSGEDLTQLDQYATQIVEYLKARPGLTNVTKSLKPGTSQLVIVPFPEELQKQNVTSDTIGFNVRLFTSGLELDKISLPGEGTDEKKIMLKLSDGVLSPEQLGSIPIPVGMGGSFQPLSALSTIKTEPSPTQISRANRKRTITIAAGVVAGQTNGAEEGTKLEEFADSLRLPTGYSWKTGGINEENAKSVQSIIQAMGLAFLLILVTMVVQFKSFRQAAIALVVIPLAISSVFFVFAITGTPLSFPALIGILALFGIIVTNSMFILDKINANREQGMRFIDSIADAGSSRLEPIVLTKLSTVLGLLPITLSTPLWRGLGGAIISGVLLASTFMLLFIPVMYYALFHKEEEAKDQSSKQ